MCTCPPGPLSPDPLAVAAPPPGSSQSPPEALVQVTQRPLSRIFKLTLIVQRDWAVDLPTWGRGGRGKAILQDTDLNVPGEREEAKEAGATDEESNEVKRPKEDWWIKCSFQYCICSSIIKYTTIV